MIEIIKFLISALKKRTEIPNPFEDGERFNYVLFEALKVFPSEPKTYVGIANEMRHRCHHCNRDQILDHKIKGTIEGSIKDGQEWFEICGVDLNFGEKYRLHPRILKKNKLKNKRIKAVMIIFNVLFWIYGLMSLFGNAVSWILKKVGLDLN